MFGGVDRETNTINSGRWANIEVKPANPDGVSSSLINSSRSRSSSSSSTSNSSSGGGSSSSSSSGM